MQNKNTWLTLFFLITAFIIAVILNFALSDLFVFFRKENKLIFGENFTLTTALASIIASLIVLYFGIINKKSKNFISECLDELNKSCWPTFSETKLKTFTVIITSLIVAIILGIFDSVFPWIIKNNIFM